MFAFLLIRCSRVCYFVWLDHCVISAGGAAVARGSVRAAFFTVKQPAFPIAGIVLGLLGVSASMTVLFGTILGLFTDGQDISMEPVCTRRLDRPVLGRH